MGFFYADIAVQEVADGYSGDICCLVCGGRIGFEAHISELTVVEIARREDSLPRTGDKICIALWGMMLGVNAWRLRC